MYKRMYVRPLFESRNQARAELYVLSTWTLLLHSGVAGSQSSGVSAKPHFLDDEVWMRRGSDVGVVTGVYPDGGVHVINTACCRSRREPTNHFGYNVAAVLARATPVLGSVFFVLGHFVDQVCVCCVVWSGAKLCGGSENAITMCAAPCQLQRHLSPLRLTQKRRRYSCAHARPRVAGSL